MTRTRIFRTHVFSMSAVAAALTLTLPPRVGAAAEGKLMIYPAKGQSEQQQSDDRYACHLRAVEQSGFDPANPPAELSQAPISVKVADNPKEGATGKGAAAGAVAGAAIGSRSHDTVGGAVAGAIAGAAIGGAIEAGGQDKARQEAEAEAKRLAAARADARAKLEQSRTAYRASIQACLEARGYVVR